jgi:hypothetical protein
MDDHSNFVLSNWLNNKINGNTFIVIGREFIRSYGAWRDGYPDGINTVEFDGLQMIGEYHRGQLQKTVLVIDAKNSLIYLLVSRDKHSEDFSVVNRIGLTDERDIDLKGLLGLHNSKEAESAGQFLMRTIHKA